MASQSHELSNLGVHSPFFRVEYPAHAVSAARHYQLPELAAEIETDQTECIDRGGCVRGICFAIAIEGIAGTGVYLLWHLFRMIL